MIFVKVSIAGVEVDALVDTGATTSCCRWDWSKDPFTMETIQSVLLSVHQGDWMVSIDLKEAYLQVPIQPDSRKYLRFMTFGKPYQFRALCFSLSTAAQSSPGLWLRSRPFSTVSAFAFISISTTGLFRPTLERQSFTLWI